MLQRKHEGDGGRGASCSTADGLLLLMTHPCTCTYEDKSFFEASAQSDGLTIFWTVSHLHLQRVPQLAHLKFLLL